MRVIIDRREGRKIMKYLKEDFEESEELSAFVYQLYNEFNLFYRVTLKLDGKVTNKFFADPDKAKEYYDMLVKEANSDKPYYDGADISLTALEISIDEDEDYEGYDEDDEEDYED